MKTLRIDFTPYTKGLEKLVRFPQIAVGPVLAWVLVVVVVGAMSGGGDVFGGVGLGFAGLLGQMIQSYGFALAIIGADAAWRRDRAPIDEAWNDASKKAGDILIAALGFQFCIFIAGIIGGMFGELFGGFAADLLKLLATYFLIYAIPAAAIGGIPGGASIQVSIDRTRANPLPTLAVVVAYWFLTAVAPPLLVGALNSLLIPVMGETAVAVSAIVDIGVFGVCNAYLAIVLAKVYSDISFGRAYF